MVQDLGYLKESASQTAGPYVHIGLTPNFADIKGVVEQIAALGWVRLNFREIELTYLVPGRAAAMMIDNHLVGVLGQLSPAIADARGLPPSEEIYVAEINLDTFTAASPIETRMAKTLPRYPFVVRDISILVNDALSAETVRGTIRSAAPDTLIQVREFDRYQGKGIPDGKVSLSFRLTFQSPERTLTDDEVQAGMQRIIDALMRELQAVQR